MTIIPMQMINFMQNNAKHVEFSVFYLLKICVLSFFDIIKYSTMREKKTHTRDVHTNAAERFVNLGLLRFK